MHESSVTIREDGRVFFFANVRSTEAGADYGTILRFWDNNNLELYTFPEIKIKNLGDGFTGWFRANLAIPSYMWGSITKVSRWDYCYD
jgi:hypothetical protein